MPLEQSGQRGSYARRGGGYFRGRGRGRGGSWQGKGNYNGNDNEYENGGARNKYYPGRSQNPDENDESHSNRQWKRPRTSTIRNNERIESDENLNTPMIQAHELPIQSHRVTSGRSKQSPDCPWIDWSVYLPQDDYHPESEYIQWIKQFKMYIEETYPEGEARVDNLKKERAIVVNLRRMAEEYFPPLMDLITHRPYDVMGCIALATIQAIYGDEVAKTQSLRTFSVRTAYYDKVTLGKNLKANLIGKMVCVAGTVVRTSGVKPFVTRLSFTCNMCQEVQTLDLSDSKYATPTKCTQYGCKGRQFTPQYGVGYGTETVDWQTIRLQEKLPDDRPDSGRVPRTIECEATNDLIDRVIPGDVVEITGIVKVAQSEKTYNRNSTGNTMYLLYLDVCFIQKATTNYEDEIYHHNESRENKDTKDSIQITVKDYYAISEVFKEPQLFKLIVNSLSPGIYGHEMVKAGILFSLFGGRRRKSGASDRTAMRSDPHILIVGDPGLGKSQMLSAAVKVAPRGVYVCGSSGISTSGLTVTLVRGKGADFALEAGALVLGDQGCCCIDEFDKMTTDHNALLEAMEQQSISIAKAGIICTLPARTSVIAAANPVGGHYNMSKTVAENLKMKGALLSRFDIIFILMDKPNSDMDEYLSKHIMALHSGNNTSESAKGSDSSKDNAPKDNASKDNASKDKATKDKEQARQLRMDRPLAERLRMTKEDKFELISHSLLRKYIAYSRIHVDPRLSPEAAATLQEYYLTLRDNYRSPDGTPVTTRQLESLIRMAEARARMEMREIVTRNDALDVIEIMTFSLQDTIVSDLSQESSHSRSQSGGGKSGAMKRFTAELKKIAHNNLSNMFTWDQLYQTFQGMQLSSVVGGFPDFLDSLNNQNFILKKGPKTYQLSC